MTTRIALALDSALDIAAARRLYDYGDLNDADVARAFEQVRMQRYGHRQPPCHMQRVTAVAWVLDADGDIRIDACEHADETALLACLSERLPTDVNTRIEFTGADTGLLAVRAALLDRVLVGALCAGTTWRLADCFGIADADSADGEAEILRLSGLAGRGPASGSLRQRAIERYRLWLRWQASRGELTPASRAAVEHGLDAALDGQAAPA